jgi:hypothetical protein
MPRQSSNGACADTQDENKHQQYSGTDSDSVQDAALSAQLSSIFKSLVRAAASARGPQHFQDAPGAILASAITSLPIETSAAARDVLEQLLSDLPAKMLTGSVPCDIAGSYEAMQAVWDRAVPMLVPQDDATATSIKAVLKGLQRNSHWVVCFGYVCMLPMTIS